MAWVLTEDLTRYLAAAGEFLRSRPAENTVQLTVVERLRARGPGTFGPAAPLFGWWTSASGAVCGAVLETPPWPMLLTSTPRGSIAPLAQVLADDGRSLAGIHAEPQVAENFAAQWHQRTGALAEVAMRERLFRLGELTPPSPPPRGRARTATAADRDLLVTWFEAFGKETRTTDSDAAESVRDRLGHAGLTLWEVEGNAVSLAGMTRQVAGMVRVGPVYTPAQSRRRGYGAAVTAAVSRSALRAGAGEVLLFTDLANPTSNALYQRLGYRPVQDRLVLGFRT